MVFKILQIILVTTVLITNWKIGESCQSKATYKEVREYAIVSYSLPSILERANRPKRNHQLVNSLKFPGHMKHPCTKLRNGFAAMTMGVIPFYYAMNITDIPGKMSPLFRFSCPTSTRVDERSYSLPIEVEPTFYERKTQYQEEQRTFNGIEEMISKSADDLSFWPALAYGLGATNSEVFSAETSTTIISYVVQIYKVKIYSNVDLLKTVMDAYANLPSNYLQNEEKFFVFIQHFGTDYRKSGVFGGRCHITLKYKGRKILEDSSQKKEVVSIGDSILGIVNFIQSQLETKITSKFILNVGGFMTFNTSLDEFHKSVDLEPAIISGSMSPMPVLLDQKDEYPDRRRAFMEARHYEEAHQLLKKTFNQIASVPTHNTLVTYLKDKVQSELEYISPPIKLVRIVEDILKINFFVDKHYLDCQLPDEKTSENAYKQKIQKYIIAPHVCVSTLAKFPKAAKGTWNLPNGKKCLTFFSNHACTGTQHTYRDADLARIFARIHEYSSFILCE